MASNAPITGAPARAPIIAAADPVSVIAIGKLFQRFDELGLYRESIEAAVDLLITCFDAIDGDPDIEDGSDPDLEPSGDENDASFPAVWSDAGHTPDASGALWGEDDEDSDEDRCTAGDDGCGAFIRDGNVLWGAVDDAQGELSADTYADPEAYRRHVTRIRRTRCFPRFVRYRSWTSGREVRELRRHVLYREPRTPSRRSLLRRKRGMPRSVRP